MLKTLNINLTDVYFNDWAQEVGEREALQFARRSSRVDEFKLVADKKDRNGRRVQQRPEETKITFLYTFVIALLESRSMEL